jgi:hypothetical protein
MNEWSSVSRTTSARAIGLELRLPRYSTGWIWQFAGSEVADSLTRMCDRAPAQYNVSAKFRVVDLFRINRVFSYSLSSIHRLAQVVPL